MTIDEYLNDAKTLKAALDKAIEALDEAEDRATYTGRPFDAVKPSRGSSNYGEHETKLIRYADAAKRFREAKDRYDEHRSQLEAAINSLYYWEGSLITHMYIYNVTFDYDVWDGVKEVLEIDDWYKVNAKVTEAKAHLAEILRAQGVDIE